MARQRAILVRAGEPAVSDHVRNQDRRDYAGFGYGAPSRVMQNSTRKGLGRASTYRKLSGLKEASPSQPGGGFGPI